MTKRIYTTFTDEQLKRVNELVGTLGSNEADVINTIIAMWMYEESKKK